MLNPNWIAGRNSVDELKHQEEAERARLKSSRVEVDRLREKLNHLERALSDSDENRRLEQVGAEMDRLRDKGKSCQRASTFERHLSSWEKGSVVKEEEDFLTLRREWILNCPPRGENAELDEENPRSFLPFAKSQRAC